MTPSEYQRRVREALRKQKAAVDAYNRDVARYNNAIKQQVAAVNRDIDRHNQEVRRQQQQRKAAVESYNRQVRAHNARVEANRRQVNRELQRLASRPATVRYEAVRTSSVQLNNAYERVSRDHPEFETDREELFFAELPARENANSLALANALAGDEGGPVEDAGTDTAITDELALISADLDARWKGALFALKPENPDAARHFCTSSREIISIILETKAPDQAVLAADANCARTPQGKPSRRSKIDYLLRRAGIASDALGEFVEQDMKNVVELFDVFNSATHGEAGKYSLATLRSIKARVEGGIFFLTKIAA